MLDNVQGIKLDRVACGPGRLCHAITYGGIVCVVCYVGDIMCGQL